MRNRIYAAVFISVLSFLVNTSLAQELLSESIVIESAAKHHPKIYINEEKIRTAEAQLQEATGEFDAKFETKYQQFTSGYYDDRGYLDSRIIKPLPVANSKIYTGHLRSVNGRYPEINQYFNTQTDGRVMFGFEFSLLRGLLINEQNALKKLAHIDVQTTKYSNILMKKQIIADARKAYWKYVYSKKIAILYQEILDVSIKRNISLSMQVKKGDRAAILVDENQRSILQRQSALQFANRELLNAAVNLSMYLRDDNGDPIEVDRVLAMEMPNEDFTTIVPETYEEDARVAQERRLDVKIANNLLSQTNIKMKVSKNSLLPIIDVGFETSQDYGTGYPEKDDRANKVRLNISIPLENNKQYGKFNKTTAEIKIIKHEIRLLQNSILNEIASTYNRIVEINNTYKNSEQEIGIATTLLKAEQVRFENGDSDFFMLNTREQDLLKTRDYCYKLRLALIEILIEYNFMTKDALSYE